MMVRVFCNGGGTRGKCFSGWGSFEAAPQAKGNVTVIIRRFGRRADELVEMIEQMVVGFRQGCRDVLSLGGSSTASSQQPAASGQWAPEPAASGPQPCFRPRVCIRPIVGALLVVSLPCCRNCCARLGTVLAAEIERLRGRGRLAMGD
jgi:hypothetical protein